MSHNGKNIAKLTSPFWVHDFLGAEPAPPGFNTSELSYPETNDGGRWRWAIGPEFSFLAEQRSHGVELRIELLYPGFDQTVEIILQGELWARLTLSRENSRITKRILLPTAIAPVSLQLRADIWNEMGRLFPGDQRGISLCLGELKLLHEGLARGKICPMPFTRREIKGGGPFVPCCSPWLTQEYFALPEAADLWNGEPARALRESVLDGSYQFCRRDLCQTQYYSYDDLPKLREPRGEFVLTDKNLQATARGQGEMPEGPTAATITADPRCNLACGSCRSELVLRLDEAGERRVEKAAEELKVAAPTLRRLRLAGDGEPLFSPFLREVIQSLSSERFPLLEIVELHTNGIFLEEKVLESLRPGSARINRVSVSVDAGDEETYRRLRGGDWARLTRNLQWAAAQRKVGRFQSLVLLYVYREENLHSMRQFVRLGLDLGVDGIHFSPFQQWERANYKNYESSAVHFATHPLHQEFLAIRAELAQNPRVTIA